MPDLIPAIEAEKAAGATRPDVVLIDEQSIKLLQEVPTSPEGQTLVAKAGSYWPTREQVTPPDKLPKLQKPFYADVEIGGEAAKQTPAKFNEVFGRS